MAAWEDGRRTGKGPGKFERWYLNARTRLSEPLQQHGAPIPLCSQKLGFLRLTCRFCGASKRMARTATGDGPPSARKARSWFAVSCEASAVACLTITGAGSPPARLTMGGIADDYQAYSLASQALVRMICSHALVCAGDPCMQAAVSDSYPHAEGLTQLCESTGCDVVELAASQRCPASVAAAHTLTADPGFGSATLVFDCQASAVGGAQAYRHETLVDEQDATGDLACGSGAQGKLRPAPRACRRSHSPRRQGRRWRC